MAFGGVGNAKRTPDAPSGGGAAGEGFSKGSMMRRSGRRRRSDRLDGRRWEAVLTSIWSAKAAGGGRARAEGRQSVGGEKGVHAPTHNTHTTRAHHGSLPKAGGKWGQSRLLVLWAVGFFAVVVCILRDDAKISSF